MISTHSVILVQSTSRAIQVERLLYRAGIFCKLIPVPRHLSSDCGVCVRISTVDQENARTTLEQEKIPYEGIFPI